MCSPVDPCGACDWCDREQGTHDVASVVRYIEERNPEMDRFFSLTFDPADLEAAGIEDDY